jgi:hypothetical protein
LRTASNSTITVDGLDQSEQPRAVIKKSVESDRYFYVLSDASSSYRGQASSVVREMWLLRPYNMLVIRDALSGVRGKTVSANFLFPNFDSSRTVLGDEEGVFSVRRNGSVFADLRFCNAKERVVVESRDGIAHTSYSYFPSDRGEGRQGSAFWVSANSVSQDGVVSLWTVLSVGVASMKKIYLSCSARELEIVLNGSSDSSQRVYLKDGVVRFLPR